MEEKDVNWNIVGVFVEMMVVWIIMEIEEVKRNEWMFEFYKVFCKRKMFLEI